MKKISLVLIFLCFKFAGNCQPMLKVSLKDSQIYCEKDNFQINYQIINNSISRLKFPSEPVLLNDIAGDFMYEVEKYNDSAKKYLPYNVGIQEMPYREIKFIGILLHKSIANSLHLPCFYSFTGKYRLRVTCFMSRFNKGVADIRSTWLAFTIVEAEKFNN